MTLTKKQKRSFLATAGLIALLFGIVVGYGLKKRNAAQMQSKLLVEALSNTMQVHRNNLGQEVAARRVIMASYKHLRATHAQDSSEIGRLKKLVTRHTISATIVHTETADTLRGNTLVSYTPAHGSNIVSAQDSCHPVYTATITDVWSSHQVTATGSITTVQCLVKNEFDFTQEYKKQGRWPFRQQYPVVTATNKNPHTRTTEIISYAVPPPAKTGKTGAAIASGILLGLVSGFIIFK